jgi:hypothetical protein
MIEGSGSGSIPVANVFLVSVRLVNGFSNLFWGWGGEDDDMANRLRIKKLFISRYPANIARYLSFSTVKGLGHEIDKT